MTGPNSKRDERSEITNNPNINRGYACEASGQQSARRLNDTEILTMNMGDAVIRKAERAERAEPREPTPSRPRQKREEEKSKQFF